MTKEEERKNIRQQETIAPERGKGGEREKERG
jgi:hypothetical protein